MLNKTSVTGWPKLPTPIYALSVTVYLAYVVFVLGPYLNVSGRPIQL